MRISDSLAESLLVKSGLFTKKQLDELRSLSRKTHKPVQDLIIKNGLLSETELTRLYAEELKLPYVELSPDIINRRAVTHLPDHVANRYNAIVFDIDDNDGSILVAMENPDDEEAVQFLQKQLGGNLRLHVTSSSLLQSALQQYRSSPRPEHILNIMGYRNSPDDIQTSNSSAMAGRSGAVESVNHIIERALSVGASDIHIEPQTGYIVIRYRIDGLLHVVHKLPASALDPLLGHIKNISNLRLQEHAAPQYGQWGVAIGDTSYQVRVSILPTVDGEKAVLHITPELSKAPSLRALGLWGHALLELQKAATAQHGTLFISGPSGSGTSTTLFSLLSALNSPSVNIATIEDPIKYRIAGVNQFQINRGSGLTFTKTLKAVLAQDPNIIMLSDVPTKQLCKMVIQASLKGHFVLSALHTTSAAAGLHRLLDMGNEPYMINSSVRAVVGQRLPRKLCPGCREAITPNKTMLEQIEKSIHLKASGGFGQLYTLEKLAFEEGIGAVNTRKTDLVLSQLSSTSRSINRLWKAREGGCSHCNNTGYRGRIGIFEVLVPTNEIQKTLNHAGSVRAISQAAAASGMISMQLDGLIKALRGQTTINEVLRVTTRG
jgi:type IV pilus assembly protein PilB